MCVVVTTPIPEVLTYILLATPFTTCLGVTTRLHTAGPRQLRVFLTHKSNLGWVCSWFLTSPRRISCRMRHRVCRSSRSSESMTFKEMRCRGLGSPLIAATTVVTLVVQRQPQS